GDRGSSARASPDRGGHLVEDPDGVLLARDAGALWALVHARQPLPHLAQRGTLDTHTAGLTGLGGPLPFLRLTLKCHCSIRGCVGMQWVAEFDRHRGLCTTSPTTLSAARVGLLEEDLPLY